MHIYKRFNSLIHHRMYKAHHGWGDEQLPFEGGPVLPVW
jgi:hypothetical protein